MNNSYCPRVSHACHFRPSLHHCPRHRFNIPFVKWSAAFGRGVIQNAGYRDLHDCDKRITENPVVNGYSKLRTRMELSTPEASAQPASISGLKRSASPALDGRRIRSGMRIRDTGMRSSESGYRCKCSEFVTLTSSRSKGIDRQNFLLAACGYQVSEDETVASDDLSYRHLNIAFEYGGCIHKRMEFSILATGTTFHRVSDSSTGVEISHYYSTNTLKG